MCVLGVAAEPEQRMGSMSSINRARIWILVSYMKLTTQHVLLDLQAEVAFCCVFVSSKSIVKNDNDHVGG